MFFWQTIALLPLSFAHPPGTPLHRGHKPLPLHSRPRYNSRGLPPICLRAAFPGGAIQFNPCYPTGLPPQS
jgi:hypothetical protein